MSYQDCIDIVKEWVIAQAYATVAWVQAQGYLTTGYVDRGDPAAHDYGIGDFNKNGVWHELDLSAIVPAGAKAVTLLMVGKNTALGKDFIVRRHGNANATTATGNRTTVANVTYYFDATVAVDTDRKIDYFFTVGGWTLAILTVKGWWL